MKESFNTNAFEVDMYAAEPDSLVPDVRILFIRIDQSRYDSLTLLQFQLSKTILVKELSISKSFGK